jgi:hypothetical protein
MKTGFRQEVFNVILAQILTEHGVISAPERIIKARPGMTRRMPDVLVDFRGLRLIIEGEVEEAPDAQERALSSARRRVEEGLAHIGVAVAYPASLRQLPELKQLKSGMQASQLKVAIVSESGVSGFVATRIENIPNLLFQTFDQLVQEDVVQRATEILDAAVEKVMPSLAAISRFPGAAARILGIRSLPDRKQSAASHEEEAAKTKLSQVEAEAVCRISPLVLINAMIFQEILSDNIEFQVSPLEKIKNEENILSAFSSQWQDILKIDYYPIFHVANELLVEITAYRASEILRSLADAAQRIVTLRAALRHDLMGRVYHKLLADKKYLATYYTRVPSAVLLLKLALGNDAFARRWHDFNDLMNFRIADLACGTGTLLMAAADTVTDNYVRAAVKAGQPPKFTDIHRVVAEEIIHGYDVLPSATHLTASTLALRAPEIAFEKMNLWNIPMGGASDSLGSIDFAYDKRITVIRDLFGAVSQGKQVTGKGEVASDHAFLPELDLCTMNPPFTRSVGGNLLFGSLDDTERAKAQTKLKKLVKRYQLSANVTAGLGSVFVAIADRYIKRGGRLALVLPKALVSGVAWAPTRELLAQNYHLEFLVASHDPERWNFSESTSLSEVMLVARKLENGEDAADKATVVLNLWRNPDTAFDALAIYYTLKNNPAPPGVQGQGAVDFSLSRSTGPYKQGEALAFPWKEVRHWQAWILACAFAQADLIRAAYHLCQGSLWLPGRRGVTPLPLRNLGDFAVLGPDRRDIHDGFKLSQHLTAYPAFWGHNAQAITTLEQTPNAFLSPMAAAKAGRTLRKADDLWPLAGRIMVAERIRMNTQRLTCVKIPDIVLSNVWWPVSLVEKFQNDANEKSLALWLNSTLGIMLFLANRLETEGAWIDFKKPVLERMPVLDLGGLSPAQSAQLAAAYDEVCREELQPFPEMAADPVRARIDAAVARTLGLPDFSILRRLLVQEPVVCLKRL